MYCLPYIYCPWILDIQTFNWFSFQFTVYTAIAIAKNEIFVHSSGKHLKTCYNNNMNITESRCQFECTSSSFCIGYKHRKDTYSDGRMVFSCHLIPNSKNCPGLFVLNKNGMLAKSPSEIVTKKVQASGPPYKCFAKNIGKVQYSAK